MSDGGIIWKNFAFYIIIAAILIIAVLYFVWTTGPIHVFIDNLASKVSLPKIDTSSITTLLSNNWTTVAGIGLTAIPLGYTTIKSYLSQQKAKKELEAAQELAKLTTSKDAVEIKALKDRLSEYESDTTNSELQKKILGFSSEKEAMQNKINSLSGQVEILSKTPANICESLWAKSGGQTVTEGGKLYRIIEKETIKVV